MVRSGRYKFFFPSDFQEIDSMLLNNNGFNGLQHDFVYNIKITPPKQMINTTFSSETFPQYGYHPAFGLYLLPESSFSEQIMSMQNHLEKQMADLRLQTTNMMRMIEDLNQQLEQKKKSTKKGKTNKIKKVYTKDKRCHHENCDKKYSSKIALNAHIKKVHQKQPQDSSQYVF